VLTREIDRYVASVAKSAQDIRQRLSAKREPDKGWETP